MASAPLSALVVLGCRPSGDLRGALGRRLARAASGWAAGEAPLVVACGGRQWEGVAEAWFMRQQLMRLGVPGEQVLAELRSLRTRENAAYAAALLRPRGVERVGVVTCDWHMPRALRAFERVGLRPTPLPAPSPPAPPATVLLRLVRERVSGWIDALV